MPDSNPDTDPQLITKTDSDPKSHFRSTPKTFKAPVHKGYLSFMRQTQEVAKPELEI
jgi:hypothetical protein